MTTPMKARLEKLRKKLPPGPAPITPSLDRLWDLTQKTVSPRQHFVDYGLETEDGKPLAWSDHRKEKP